MSFLIIGGDRYALPIGETTLGGAADAQFAPPALASLPPFAVVSVELSGATIRAIPGAPRITIGGSPLGPQPRTLRHGDRVVVDKIVIAYGDMRHSGSTARTPGVGDAAPTASQMPESEPTADTGGRITVLATGREYQIPRTGLVIGRDPQCDVVLESRRVSRRHALVAPGLLGYTIADQSTNGVFVNGLRVDQVTRLGQGDVVRVGDVELRFHADAASYEPDASVWAATPPALAQTPPASATPATHGAAEVHPAPASAAPAPAPTLLATLEVLSGNLPRGECFRIERAAVQLGRGARNDIRLGDESVSSAHATLVQRGGRWHLLDLDSRNGSYVDGQRVTDCVLPASCELRLGNLALLFRCIASADAETVGTLGVIGLTDPQANRRRKAR